MQEGDATRASVGEENSITEPLLSDGELLDPKSRQNEEFPHRDERVEEY